jgi:hypothetical protein
MGRGAGAGVRLPVSSGERQPGAALELHA